MLAHAHAEGRPSSLDSPTLSRRLAQLAGDERAVQADFLAHLEEYDRRRAWAEEGYGSLWDYCLRVLHLREGATARRITAMRVLRRFPVLADHLRDARLCLSTLALLGPVLTEENLCDVVEQAAFMTKGQVERLVAAMAPRSAPKEGLRRLPARVEAPVLVQQVTEDAAPLLRIATGLAAVTTAARHQPQAPAADSTPSPTVAPAASASRPTVRPVDATTYSLRVTVDEAFKAELELLKDLLAHKVPNGDLAAVLREAVHCAIEKHGKRKGAVAPSPKTKGSSAPAGSTPSTERGRRPAIPAEVRREVWKRDGGRCAWLGPGGQRCGSTWKLEVDHIRPAALSGPSTVENLRLACRSHNQLSAEQAFGREFMERMRAAPSRTGLITAPGEMKSAALVLRLRFATLMTAAEGAAPGSGRPAARGAAPP